MDVVALSKLQFALTVMYHFLFVPLSIGVGLVPPTPAGLSQS